ncbi:MAG TPA: FAD-dependent oxidoreductase [Polyangiaceae bacterium]|nr:FAD-dependent oxidoreductase [Polyangiaceae bacterium]
MTQKTASMDVVVVGGGIAGLAVAAYVAAAGRSVRVLEKASRLGGRGATEVVSGFSLNRGPHALYRASEGAKVLAEVGVETPGRSPSGAGFAIHRGALHDLPGKALSLLGTSLLRFNEKATVARLMARLPTLDAESLSGTTVTEFLDREGARGTVRSLLEALFRLTTYQNEPDRESARTPVRKLQHAMKGGVLYVDGGWQTLVRGLAKRAEAYGATIEVSRRVAALRHEGARVTGVTLADGTELSASVVVLTCDPHHVKALLDGAHLPSPSGLANVVPVRVATLDLALRKLTRPEHLFAVGIDRPLYYSVHSASAALGPEGHAMIHVSKYLGAETTDEDADRKELEGLMDLMQPGWRSECVHAQWLPRMVAAERLDRADDGGPEGRPAAVVPEARGLYLAGDWVQGGSFLVDASLESARLASSSILRAFERMRSVA